MVQHADRKQRAERRVFRMVKLKMSHGGVSVSDGWDAMRNTEVGPAIHREATDVRDMARDVPPLQLANRGQGSHGTDGLGPVRARDERVL